MPYLILILGANILSDDIKEETDDQPQTVNKK